MGNHAGIVAIRELRVNDFSANRDNVEAALMARMQPDLDRQRQALDSSLANQGIGYGAEAYGDAQFTRSQAENDARMSAIIGGGAEQQRLQQMDLAGRGFTNNSRQAGLDNRNRAVSGNNANRGQAFGEGMAQFGAQNGQRSQALQQIMAMLQGSQPNVPNYTPNRPSPIPTTDNAGLINNNYQQQQQNYQTQMAQWQNTIGNLFGIGAAAVGA
jgi:hypothetical protein